MPSLARRLLAGLVLVLVVVVVLRMIIGAITAALWLAALVALLVAGLWAFGTLRSAKRARAERKGQRPQALGPATERERVDAQVEELKRQLRDQGRL